MALVVKDRVNETSTTTGTGTFTLAGAVTGFQTFAAIGDGNTTYYTIVLQGGSEWEVGLGTYSTGATGATQTAGPTTGSWVTNGSLVGSNVTWYSASDTGYTAGDYVLLFDQTAGSSFFYYGQITLIQFAGGFGYAFYADLISDGGTPNGDPSSSWLMQESTGTTLTRTAVLSSSNSGSLVTFSAGTKNVFCDYPAPKAVYGDATNTAFQAQFAASNGLMMNNMTVGTTFSIPSGYSASSVGPVVVSGGVTITVPSGSRWVVL